MNVNPGPATLALVLGATVASLGAAMLLARFVGESLIRPADTLDRFLGDSNDYRGIEQLDNAALRGLARAIRRRIDDERHQAGMASASIETGTARRDRPAPVSHHDDPPISTVRDDESEYIDAIATAASALKAGLTEGEDPASPAVGRLLRRLELLNDEYEATDYARDYVEAVDLRSIVDHAVDAAAALGRSITVPVFGDGVETRVRANASALSALVLQYLASLPEGGGYLHVRRLGDHGLALFATAWHEGTSRRARLEALMDIVDANFEDGLLEIPELDFEPTTAPATLPGAARVIASGDGEHRALCSRLTGLGYRIASEGDRASICLVAGERDEAIAALIEETAGTGRLIVAGPGPRFALEHVVHIDYPIYHDELVAALESRAPARRILAVDDDLRGLTLLDEQCRGRDIEIVPAANAATARLVAAENAFDAALIDVNLPDGNGLALAAELRKHLDSAPVFVLTAHRDGVSAEEIRRSGIHAVFEKPLDVDALEAILAGRDTPRPLATGDGNQHPRFDPELALRLAHYRPEVAAELMNALVDSLPGDIEEIAAALEDRDRDLLRDLAHRLNGGLQYCGVPRLRHAVRTLESAARHDKHEDVRLAFLVCKAETTALIELYDRNENHFQTSVIPAAD